MRIALGDVEYYVEYAGAGTPLLLLHGFTGSHAMWAPFQAAWADRFALIAPDLPGHGATSAPIDPGRYDMAHTVADLAALLDRLGVIRAHVAGYSMGGRVALHFAAAHPERVGALVLESASPGLAGADERAARAAADAALADFVESAGVPAFVDRWEALPLWASQARLPEAARAGLRAQRLTNRAAGLANSLRGLGTGSQAPLHARLATLALPVLCLAGALDTKYAAIAESMAAALPAGGALIVPEAGHAVHLEQPDAFAREVAAFLETQRGLVPHSYAFDEETTHYGDHVGNPA